MQHSARPFTGGRERAFFKLCGASAAVLRERYRPGLGSMCRTSRLNGIGGLFRILTLAAYAGTSQPFSANTWAASLYCRGYLALLGGYLLDGSIPFAPSARRSHDFRSISTCAASPLHRLARDPLRSAAHIWWRYRQRVDSTLVFVDTPPRTPRRTVLAEQVRRSLYTIRRTHHRHTVALRTS